MKLHIIGDAVGIPHYSRYETGAIPPSYLTDMRYMLYYHDDCDGVIITAPDAATLVDRARIRQSTPVLAIGKGLLSCAKIPGPTPDAPETIVLRTGSQPQEWFGTETIERKLVATIDGKHAAKHRLPISGITMAQHGAIYDPEDHPFLVGIGWYPEADDPIWLAFIDAVVSKRSYV